MAAAGDGYPRSLERLIVFLVGTLVALYLFLPAAYPQHFAAKTKTETAADPPGYLGIIQRSCSVETITDNEGTRNGFRLRAKLIYKAPERQEWSRVIGMYRPEDEKKAHLDCLKWQKQTFEKIWDARKKAGAARKDAKPNLEGPLRPERQ